MNAAQQAVVCEWESEARGQEYTLRHGDTVLFWIPDERQPAFGTVVYLWGYVPAIVCEGRSFRFQDVCWVIGSN